MFKSAATKIAHNSTIPSLAVGNKDLRTLQDLINAEKSVLISFQRLSVDFAKAADALRAWGLGEGDDLGDTLGAATILLQQVSSSFSQYATHELSIRDSMKSVRSREEALDEMKRRRKALISKADAAEKKLSKMNPEHKNLQMQTETLNRLRDEIHAIDGEIMTEEAALSDFKRSTTRRWMGTKFGGLLECCEKGTIAAEYGKLIISEIPEDITQPGMSRTLYTGHSKVNSLVTEAQQCISEVQFTAVPVADMGERRKFQPPPNDFGLDRSPATPSGAAASGWPVPPSQSDYPPPSGYGPAPGHFFDASEAPSTTTGVSSVPDTPTGPMYFPQPQPHVSDRPPELSQLTTTDDFGVNMGGGAAGAPDGPGGGRFATFPVKHQRGYSLRDDGPSPVTGSGSLGGPSPLGGGKQDEDQSFASAVEEALRGSGFGTAVPSYEPPAGPPPGAGYAGLPPSYAPPSGPPPGHQYDPPTGPPPDASLPLPATPNPWRNSIAHSDDDVHLAYAASEDDHASQQRPVSHHVRFGEVSDVEEELEKRARDQAALPSVPPLNIHHHKESSPKRVPPPTFSPEEEEKALNAAAAREISREMDALSFSPPQQEVKGGNVSASPPSMSPERGRSMESSSPLNERAPSPLLPPSAPFANRSVSPNYENMSAAQSYAMAHKPSESFSSSSQPPPAVDPIPAPAPVDASPRPRHQPMPSIQLPERSASPAHSLTHAPSPSLGGSTPFRTPPEYPRYNTSTSSVNVNQQTGARTISAAAFRRPQPRLDSSGDKKRLPSSPYPPGGRVPGGPVSPSSMSRGESLPGARDRSGSIPPAAPAAQEDEDHYDYISAYTDNPNAQNTDSGSPLKSDYGSLGNPKVVNSEDAGGYGNGRSSTDVDGLR